MSTGGRSASTWPSWPGRRWRWCGGAVPTERRPPEAAAGVLSVREAARRSATPAVPSAPRRPTGGRRARERRLAAAVVAAGAVAGALVAVRPTGVEVADRVLAGGFVALVAAAASNARRWTWFVVAVAGLALAEGRPA